MTLDRMAMEQLREYLQRQMDQRGWTLLRAEAETGVAKSTIDNIIKGRGTITLETAYRLADALEIPRWRILEMAGFPAGVPLDDAGLAVRIKALKEKAPEIGDVLDRLAGYDRQDVQAVLAYMERMEDLRRRPPR